MSSSSCCCECECEHHELENLGVPSIFARFIEKKINLDMEVHPPTKSSEVSEVVLFIPFDSFPKLHMDDGHLVADLFKQSRGKGWFIPPEKTGIAFSFFQFYDGTEQDRLYTDPKLAEANSFVQELQQIMGKESIKYALWVQNTIPNKKRKNLVDTLSFSFGSVRSHRIIPKSLYTAIP
jgi:hypothetical protein